MARKVKKKAPETKIKTNKVKEAWDNLSTATQHIAVFIGNLTVIVGLIIAAVSAIKDSVNGAVHEVADPIAETSEANAKENRLAIQRVELMLLMKEYPDHVVEIESTAVSYFNNDGNHYIESLYSQWCQEYSPDSCHIMLDIERQ